MHARSTFPCGVARLVDPNKGGPRHGNEDILGLAAVKPLAARSPSKQGATHATGSEPTLARFARKAARRKRRANEVANPEVAEFLIIDAAATITRIAAIDTIVIGTAMFRLRLKLNDPAHKFMAHDGAWIEPRLVTTKGMEI